MKKKIFIAFMGVATLSACSQRSVPEPKVADTRIILNTMGNGLLGRSATSLSPADRGKALEAEYKALEYTDAGKSVNWSSSQGGSSGSVTPGQPYQVGSQNCRQYSHSFVIGGIPQTARGSACRNANGSWSPLT